MYLTLLTLDQFRSYGHCVASLTPGLTLVLGDNATGKSNLLEAAYMLAALRSPRAGTEGEVMAWDAPRPPVTRLDGRAERSDGPVRVEIAIAARTDARGAVLQARSGAPLTSKRVRLNGVPRRSADAVGAIAAVLFTTLDIEIITGSPAQRRRFLDFTLSQADRAYARALRQYERTLTQRNALLKRISKGQATAAQLPVWDQPLAAAGSVIIAGRAAAMRDLEAGAHRHHAELSAEDAAAAEVLALTYQPALAAAGLPPTPSIEAVQERLLAALAAQRSREVAAGTTLAGPHRDDMAILLDGHAAAAYASRAQQRTAALALRLAEADLLRHRTGEIPILLLDDIFSELDPRRRAATARAIGTAEQVLLTAADPAAVPEGLAAPAAVYRVTRAGLDRVG